MGPLDKMLGRDPSGPITGDAKKAGASNPMEMMALRLLENLGLNAEALKSVGGNVELFLTYVKTSFEEAAIRDAKILAYLEAMATDETRARVTAEFDRPQQSDI